jgi:hypothetical protein
MVGWRGDGLLEFVLICVNESERGRSIGDVGLGLFFCTWILNFW